MCFENFIFALTTTDLWKCFSDKVCNINTRTSQLYEFSLVYNRSFNAYAIFIAKDRKKKLTKIIIDENGIPQILVSVNDFLLIFWQFHRNNSIKSKRRTIKIFVNLLCNLNSHQSFSEANFKRYIVSFFLFSRLVLVLGVAGRTLWLFHLFFVVSS